MADLTYHATLKTDGWVIWVVDNPVAKGEYHPAVEMLMVQLYFQYGTAVICERPAIWHKNAAPNRHGPNGRQDWFVHEWEFCVAFRRRELSIPDFHWERIAEAPKCKPGGAFRQRNAKGERRVGEAVKAHKLARPRDVRRYVVGGGLMGSKLAHEGEAPFPESIINDFVLAFTNPGQKVLDPFIGSGTTAAVCVKQKRKWVGLDVRDSQRLLTTRRVAEAMGLGG